MSTQQPKFIKFKGATYRLADKQPEEQYTDAKHAFEESKQEFERLRKLFEYLTDKVYREELTPGEALVILTQKEGFPSEERYPESKPAPWSEPFKGTGS